MSYLGNVAGPVKSVAGKVGEVELNNGDVGLNNVTNDAQLKIASNLADLNNAATARTNLGLGTAAVANILGTVSQSGGIPTGAVVERGSNANGEYVRFADGTQICFVFRWPAASLSGGKRIIFAWTFPAAFLNQTQLPVVTGAIDLNAVFSSGWNTDFFYVATTEAASTAGTLSITTDYSGASIGWGDQRASLTAIGRWY